MSENGPAGRSVEEQLLDRPRRIAGIDGLGRPVRLGEFDSQGYLVGYIDEDGLAWESLRERIVAICGNRLADAMALPYEHPGRDQAMKRAMADVPDELITAVAAQAAGRLHLWGESP
jgi:hypothetical protein